MAGRLLARFRRDAGRLRTPRSNEAAGRGALAVTYLRPTHGLTGSVSQPLQPATPAEQEVGLLEAGEAPAFFVGLGDRAVLGAGLVDRVLARLVTPLPVVKAAGHDQDVFLGQVAVCGQEAARREVAEQEHAARPGIARQLRVPGTRCERPAPGKAPQGRQRR